MTVTVFIKFWLDGNEICFHLPEGVFEEVIQEAEEVKVYVRPGTAAEAITWLEKGHGIPNYLMYRAGNGGGSIKFQGQHRGLRIKLELEK